MLRIFGLLVFAITFSACKPEPIPGPQGPAGVDSSPTFYFTQGVAGFNGEVSSVIRNGSYIDTNYGNSSVISMGWSYSHVVRGLLRTDVSSIKNKVLGDTSTEQQCLDTLVVNDALVYMKQGLPQNDSTVWVYALKDTAPLFVPTEVTWNKASNSANWTAAGGLSDTGTILDHVLLNAEPAFGWRSFRIPRSVAKLWICSPAKNKGMLFKSSNESNSNGFIDATVSLITGNSSEDQRPIFYFNVVKYDASMAAGKTEGLPSDQGRELEILKNHLNNH